MTQKRKTEIINHLFNSACGYGMAEGREYNDDGTLIPNFNYSNSKVNTIGGKNALSKCINAIPNEYLDDFLYTLYRIADKSGSDGFSI